MATLAQRLARSTLLLQIFSAALVSGAVLALTSAAAAASPIGWDARGGWYTERDAAFVGGGAIVGLGTITFNPNAEYVFVDSGSSYSFNLDGRMTVLPLGVGSGWLGAGLGFYTTDPDHGSSNTDTGFNLLAGAGLNAIPLKPFAQFKWVVIGGSDPVAFTVGVRF